MAPDPSSFICKVPLPIPIDTVIGDVKLFPPSVERVKKTPWPADQATSMLFFESTAISGRPPGTPLETTIGVVKLCERALAAQRKTAAPNTACQNSRASLCPDREGAQTVNNCAEFIRESELNILENCWGLELLVVLRSALRVRKTVVQHDVLPTLAETLGCTFGRARGLPVSSVLKMQGLTSAARCGPAKRCTYSPGDFSMDVRKSIADPNNC